MRLPAAIRPLLPVCAVAGLLLAGLQPARSQYSGGASGGDGYALAGVRHGVLDGASLNSPAYTAGSTGGDGYSLNGQRHLKLNGDSLPSPLYTASSTGGDGYSKSGKLFIPLNGISLPSQLYTAGSSGGDGYSRLGLINKAINGAAGFLSSFKGGSGDGYDQQGLENKFIDATAASFVMYYSGASGGDGYDMDGLRHAALSGPDAPAGMYSASESGGDGYDRDGSIFVSLDGSASLVEVYTASANGGDGYDRDGVIFVSLSGIVPPDFAYLGDDGDGYSRDGLHHAPLSVPASGLAYAGGEGDGYDLRSLPFVQYLGGGEAASGITFEGWLNSRFSDEEAAAGLAAPGFDADADGLSNLIEFAIGSDPRVPDATALGPQFRLSNLSELGYPALADHYLTAIVRRNPLALDATLRVEVTSDVSSLWSANQIVPVDSIPSAFIVRDQFGVQVAPRRSMRLRATLTP